MPFLNSFQNHNYVLNYRGLGLKIVGKSERLCIPVLCCYHVVKPLLTKIIVCIKIKWGPCANSWQKLGLVPWSGDSTLQFLLYTSQINFTFNYMYSKHYIQLPSLDSGPIYSLRYIRPFAIPVFTKDREMALYPRIAILEKNLSGYRDQWDIAKDDIATSKKVQNLD